MFMHASCKPGRTIARISAPSVGIASLFALLLVAAAAQSQPVDCGCRVTDVLNNTVSPCTRVIGETVTVRTADELRNAIRLANDGGGQVTILIENGVYRIASTTSFPYITANDVVIRSASGKRDSVILEGGGMRDTAPDTENGMLIAGDRVTVADITIRNVGNHAIQLSGHDVLVHNVRIQNTFEQMIKGATARNSIERGVVQCCLLEYTAGIGPQYYIGGLDIHKGRDWTVRDNVLRGIRSPSASVAEHAVHFWNSSENNTVERNIIINCDRGIGFGLGNSSNTGGMIRNNMIYNDGSGAFTDVGIGLESSPGTRVYNNTVATSYRNAIEYRFSSTRDVEIINNLCNRAIASRDGGSAMVLSNITDATWDFFVDAASGNLRLAKAHTRVVDMGQSIPEHVRDDIDKTARPRGAGYDIGAHEYIAPASAAFPSSTPRMHIFPNPALSAVSIHTDASVHVEMYDLTGKLIFRSDSRSERHDIDMSRRPKGVYLILLYTYGSVMRSGMLLLL
jgi:hypothetical protein